MSKDKKHKSGNKNVDSKGCGCTDPGCTSGSPSNPGGIKFPTHGWGRAIIFAFIMTFTAAVVLTFIPPKKPADQSNAGKDEAGTDITSKIEKIQAGESDTEIILSQGSTEAPPAVEIPSPPGGLSWESLRYPDSERLLTYSGKKLKADEQAYVTSDPYENVKAYYIKLINNEFHAAPQESELTDARGTQLALQNQTGSLSVWMKVPPYEKKVYILVTKLENLSGENLKTFGGPKEEQEKKYGKGK